MSKHKSDSPATITLNRRATFNYFIEERLEAGLVLQGWEIKSIRAGRVQINEAHVLMRGNEAWLIGAHISPLATVSTHFVPDSTRTRKLLLHRNQISHLIGSVEREGYTLIPLDLHWNKGNVKIALGLAKGKKQHDKRETIKQREWQKEKLRILKRG